MKSARDLACRYSGILISLFFLANASILFGRNEAAAPSPGNLTEQTLFNETYIVGHHNVKLINCNGFGGSKFKTTDPDEDNTCYWSVSLDSSLIAFGDLGGDAKKCAAVVLQFDRGNSNSQPKTELHLVVVVDRKGKLTQVGDMAIGDASKIKIEQLQIRSGAIVGQIGTCGQHRQKQHKSFFVTFKVSNNKLVTIAAPKLKPPGLFLSETSLSTDPTDVPVPTVTSLESMPNIVWKDSMAMGISNISGITNSTVNNARYKIGTDKPAKLTNGSFTGHYPKEIIVPGDSPTWSIRTENIALGDLNRDGRNDAAVVLVYNGGGNGSFYSLVPVINNKGQLYQVGEIDLGDRISVKDLKIKSGTIAIDLVVHDANDAMVEPTKPVSWKFKIAHNELIKVR